MTLRKAHIHADIFLKDFFNQRDTSDSTTHHSHTGSHGVELTNVSISRGNEKETFTMKVPKMKVKDKELCLLIGRVGSGKVML